MPHEGTGFVPVGDTFFHSRDTGPSRLEHVASVLDVIMLLPQANLAMSETQVRSMVDGCRILCEQNESVVNSLLDGGTPGYAAEAQTLQIIDDGLYAPRDFVTALWFEFPKDGIDPSYLDQLAKDLRICMLESAILSLAGVKLCEFSVLQLYKFSNITPMSNNAYSWAMLLDLTEYSNGNNYI